MRICSHEAVDLVRIMSIAHEIEMETTFLQSHKMNRPTGDSGPRWNFGIGSPIKAKAISTIKSPNPFASTAASISKPKYAELPAPKPPDVIPTHPSNLSKPSCLRPTNLNPFTIEVAVLANRPIKSSLTCAPKGYVTSASSHFIPCMNALTNLSE